VNLGCLSARGRNRVLFDNLLRNIALASFDIDRPAISGNLMAAQLLLGPTKIESTVRYFGIEADDALEIAEQVDV
jgi:hypothetical protein